MKQRSSHSLIVYIILLLLNYFRPIILGCLMSHNIVFCFSAVLDFHEIYLFDDLCEVLEREERNWVVFSTQTLRLGTIYCVEKRFGKVKLLEIYLRFYKYLFLVRHSLHSLYKPLIEYIENIFVNSVSCTSS